MNHHQRLDDRSLAMHVYVAARLREHPERLSEAEAILARWARSAGERVQPALEEWSAILRSGLDATIAAAVDPSEEGKRRRQSSPLLCLLDPRERWALLRQWTGANDAP